MSDLLADRYDLLIFDLDGVVVLGDQPVPGAVSALARLRQRRANVVYATNNASKSAAEVAALLSTVGVPARVGEVITSAQATASILAGRLPAGSPVLVVGSPALADELAAAGLQPVREADEGPVAVVQGYGPGVGWPLLAEGCIAIRAGASWVATNRDSTLPSPRGPLPGNGALVAALVTATGREPDLVVGKPSPVLFEQAARQRNAYRPLVIGDRLDTDIEGATRAGMDSLLVLTGVAGPADVLAAPPARRPTYLAADLGALFAAEDAVAVGAGPTGWQVRLDGADVVLSGEGRPVAALRELCAAAWWRGVGVAEPRVRPDGAAAAAVLTELGIVPAKPRPSTASSGA